MLALALSLQILTFIMMLKWQAEAEMRLEGKLSAIEAYNQNTRERLQKIEARIEK